MRNALFASFGLTPVLFVYDLRVPAGDARPQAVGSAGLGQDDCTTQGICDSGAATGAAGKSGTSGVAGAGRQLAEAWAL